MIKIKCANKVDALGITNRLTFQEFGFTFSKQGKLFVIELAEHLFNEKDLIGDRKLITISRPVTMT